MPAPVGNRFWEARSSHGRKPIFAAPGDLWRAAIEYFEWVEANPLHKTKAFAYQGDVTIANVPRMRAMTILGLCVFLDIDRATWAAYRENEGFSAIVARVEDVIRTQKFEGASADLLNPSIIARDLGLADKSELTGKDGQPLQAQFVMIGAPEAPSTEAWLAKYAPKSTGG